MASTMRYVGAAVVALGLVGCDSSGGGVLDMAATADDLASPVDDFAVGTDLATKDLDATVFCDHVRAALAGGTPTDCAVAFMAKMMSCFTPTGACGGTLTPSSNDSCWTNGAAFQKTHVLGNEGYTYGMSGRRCGTIGADTGGPFSAQLCVPTTSYDCHAEQPGDMAGSGAYYLGGTFTCPDGTKVSVGQIFNCAEVMKLLVPACDHTVDAGGCVVP